MFDWKIEQMGPAAMIQTGGAGGIGAHITALGHEPHHYVTVYLQVDEIGAALAKAEALGGKRLVPAIEISTGSFAWFADPEGNTIGLWKPAAA
jgi:predicted enzyme related to lactoylglutathione lyase